jgi:hypothetical protein
MASETKRVSAKGRQAGDYSPPILAQPKGGPIPKWTGDPKREAPKTPQVAAPQQLELPIAAGVADDAARIAAELAAAVSSFAGSWPALAAPIVSGLVTDVGNALTGGGVGRLAQLAAGTGAVTALGTALGRAMRTLSGRAARRAAREVEALGVTASAGTANPVNLQGQADVTASLAGQALASSAARTALLYAGRPADAVNAAVEAELRDLADLKPGGYILQNLEAALAAAQGAGRMATFAQVEDRVSLMAAESPGACATCEDIDGKVFASFAAAAKAYPQGRHVGCLGRSHCRGRLVPVRRQ